MPVKVRQRINKLGKRFLWFGGDTVRKKSSLISWKVVCSNKDQGGLGVINLDTINRALLAKWWIR